MNVDGSFNSVFPSGLPSLHLIIFKTKDLSVEESFASTSFEYIRITNKNLLKPLSFLYLITEEANVDLVFMTKTHYNKTGFGYPPDYKKCQEILQVGSSTFSGCILIFTEINQGHAQFR